MEKVWMILLLIFLLPLPGKTATAQDTTRSARLLGVRLHQGFVLVHSRELWPDLRNSYPTGLEMDFAWHKISEKAWKSCHCYPKLGVALSLWDYDEPDILGQGLTGMFYIEPVFGARNKVSFSVRAAFGLSYQNRPYDSLDNPRNTSYSTYVAFPLQLGGNLHFQLAPRWVLDVTAVYNHFSNGGIREPNKGINWPSAALGLGYYLDEPRFYVREKKHWREEMTPESRFDITFLLAFQEPESKLYLFSPGFELKFSRQVARINALTAGVEWLFDNQAAHELEQAGRTESSQKGSAAIGHEFLLGKVLFSQQFGVYLYRPYKSGTDVYQRYGLAWRASKQLHFGINLKAHGHVADFLDFRAGVSF